MSYRARRNREEDEENQDWLTSHADLMTLLLGFFVILFIISHIDEGKLREVTKSFTAAFENPSQGTGTPASISERSEQSLNAIFDIMNLEGSYAQKLTELEQRFESKDNLDENRMLLQKELESVAEPIKEKKALKIILDEKILFQPGKTEIKNSAKPKLLKIVKTIKPYISSEVVVEVAGHTDGSTPKRRSKNNFLISSLRAGNVADFAIKSGLPKKNIRVNGMADIKPVILETGLYGKALRVARSKNRRVEIILRFPR